MDLLHFELYFILLFYVPAYLVVIGHIGYSRTNWCIGLYIRFCSSAVTSDLDYQSILSNIDELRE